MNHDKFCAYCGGPGPFEWDHIIPKSRGGLNSEINLITACKPCNRLKRDSLPSECFEELPRAMYAIEEWLVAEWSARQELAMRRSFSGVK